MAAPIGPLSGSAPVAPASAESLTRPPSAPGFAESLKRLVDVVDESAGTANTAVERMLNGTGDVHDAMLALHRAETAFQLSVQMRNKLVQAYQEIMRMPV
jgi:flagellar hook-basal body complex protein FliE